jgi:glycolate oxidase iron-sulfur subunit
MKRTFANQITPSHLEHFRQKIERCVKCGSCRAVCPPFLQEQGESYSARGRMALVKAVLERKLAASDIFKDRLATCTGCLACEASCPSGVPVAEIIQAAKEEAVRESGIGIINKIVSEVLKHPAALQATAWLAPFVMHYSKRHDFAGGKRLDENTELRVQKTTGTVIGSHAPRMRGKVALFSGCAIDNYKPEIGRATKNVLNSLGYEVISPKGLKCCGRPLLSLGHRAAAEELAAHNVAVLSAVKADAIVTACASCGLTFKKDYPTLLRLDGNPLNFLDIHEFLSTKLGGISLAPYTGSVTIHDPCHLNRGQGLSQVLRNLLRSIPHLMIKEMRNADRCCGFGGVMRVTHQKLSDSIAEKKARDIIATQTAVVVTGCPGCSMQIANALMLAGSNVKVMHTVQLLEKALLIEKCRLDYSDLVIVKQ